MFSIPMYNTLLIYEHKFNSITVFINMHLQKRAGRYLGEDPRNSSLRLSRDE